MAMSKDRRPAQVLGWLTTSANYTVVSSSAPSEYRATPSVQVTRTECPTDTRATSPAPSPRKDFIKTA